MEDIIWLIPALPLLGFITLVFLGRRLGDPGAGWLATAMIAGSFVVSVAIFVSMVGSPADERQLTQTLFTWIPAGDFTVNIGFLVDQLSILMALFVTGIGALIHLYSIGYMKGDPKFSKFFVYLNLFVASMLLLVLGDNLLLTFLGWEGVGTCSYLLISFWHTDPANASAGKKAFVTNRVGDVGFMIGTFLVWTTIGSINYVDIPDAAPMIAAGTATAIALLFFVGAVGKSAQMPLFVWLPDAMAGPTPVSALIHAATMVTAGVYLITRLNSIMEYAGWANDVIAWVGAITAFVAATIAISQNDIKKVLAYSTVSQLGFMFIAVGTQTYVAGIFHMVTHAFFKALLFLGSGAVIAAMAHEQDMRKYGNLRKYLPITHITFMVGWLAIIGIPPLAGFWSKDEILAGAFNTGSTGIALWAIGLAAAIMTAFYMTRQIIMTFYGDEKWREQPEEAGEEEHSEADHADHHLTPDHTPKEPSWHMTLPLVVLAGMAVIAGILNLPFAQNLKYLENWLMPIIAYENHLPDAPVVAVLAVVATLAAIAGALGAYAVYVRKKVEREKIELELFERGWYIDETFSKITDNVGQPAFQATADGDKVVVDGVVTGVAAGAVGASSFIKKFQSGLVRSYAIGVAGAAVALLVYIVTRMNLS